MDNLSFGLDIATALSVIGAAVSFIWNIRKENKKKQEDRERIFKNEQKERQRRHIRQTVLKVTDKLTDEATEMFEDVQRIKSMVLDGATTLDLTPYKLKVERLIFTFGVRIKSLDKIYGDNIFGQLVEEYKNEMNNSILVVSNVTSGETDEKWDFEEVMYAPVNITGAYSTKLFVESEKYLEDI